MSERITRHDVIHVARLARLELTDDEIGRFAEQLGDVLDHASDIEALDLEDVAPTSHPLDMANVTRPDELRESLPHSEVLAGAPAAEAGRFRVPPILGGTDGGGRDSGADSGTDDPHRAADGAGTDGGPDRAAAGSATAEPT